MTLIRLTKIEMEIQEIEEQVEESEAQYGVILEELGLATEAITKVEQDILNSRTTPELFAKSGKNRQGHKKDQSFTMDNETKLYLTSRKDEIIDEMPLLKLKKQELNY